jgi:hypothetical protein
MKMYTDVYIDGTISRTLNRGEYADIEGSQFTNGNLYVRTSKSVSAYQSIGGSNTTNSHQRIQKIFFCSNQPHQIL